MAIQELVSIPFLVSIVITCVLVAAVSFLFYNKMQQQSAKISAIMDLTTTLVSEVNSIKSSEHAGIGGRGGVESNSQGNTLEEPTGLMNDIHKVDMKVPFMTGGMDVLDPLIDVSEDEEAESSDEVESNTETSDDDTDGDGDAEEDEEEEDEEDEDDDEEEEDDDNENRVVELDSDEASDKKFSNIADIDEDEVLEVEELQDDASDLGIDVTNLNFEKFAEEDEEIRLKSESKVIEIGEQDVTDYSKYTVSELRKVAFSRGLIGDNEKPNKNKLIKMLSA
jgi:hypothetical protein